MIKHSVIIFIIISFFLTKINAFLYKISGNKDKYCFRKIINENETLSLSFVVSSDNSETIKVTLTRLFNNEIIYKEEKTESGIFKSEKGEDGGKYELCFFPFSKNKFYISFEFYTIEEENIKELAKDIDIQYMVEEFKAVNTAFTEIENNARHINDKRFRNTKILRKIINSVENWTIIKIIIISLLSILQVFIIRKFFGPDKRLSKVKGAYSTEL